MNAIPTLSSLPIAWTPPRHRRKRSRRAVALDVARESAERHEVAPATLYRRGRTPRVVAARHDAFRRLRALGYTFPEIAEHFGCHNSTVQYACKKASLGEQR